jgi:hypothetical protein
VVGVVNGAMVALLAGVSGGGACGVRGAHKPAHRRTRPVSTRSARHARQYKSALNASNGVGSACAL